MPATKRRVGGKRNTGKRTAAKKSGKRGRKTATTRGSGRKKKLLTVRPELFDQIPSLTATRAKFPASEDTLESYLAYFPSFELLTPEEERYFARLARLGDELGRARLVMHNIRLVASEALNYYNTRIPDNTQIATVIQEGIFGLIRAVERFDPERGYRFSTYATHWIRRFIYRGSNSLRFIRLPHYIHGILARLPSVTEELKRTNGGVEPSPAAIAKRLKEREGAYHLAVKASHSTNIVKPAVNDDHVPESRIAEDYLDACNEDPNAEDPLDLLIHSEMSERIKKALRKLLTARDRKVVCMRFGLGYPRAYTLQEIGEKVNLSRERIRQIENSSLKRLKEHLKEEQNV